VARWFMEGTVTLFIMAQKRGVDISWASVFPVEKEIVLPSNTVLTVMSKLPDNLLTLLETNADVVVVMESSGKGKLKAAQAVDLSLLAILEGSFVYDSFLQRYIEPRLESGGADVRLYSFFEEFLKNPDKQVLLLSGGGGTG